MKFYGLFCLTTSIMAIFYLFIPAIKGLESSNNIQQNKLVATLTFVTFSLLVAPVIFIAVIIPSARERFVEAMAEAFKN